jgi:hypothetical protein
LKRLVYFEVYDDIQTAIQREHNMSIGHAPGKCGWSWRRMRNGKTCSTH